MKFYTFETDRDNRMLLVDWSTYEFDNLSSKEIQDELRKHHIYYVSGSPYALLHKGDFWYLGSEDDRAITFYKDRRYHEDWHKYFVKTVKESKHGY